MKMKNYHRSKFSNFSSWKEEAWKKNQGFNGIRNRDLHDTDAMLYQLSYKATHLEWGQVGKFAAIVILLLHLQTQYNIWVISHNLTSFCQHEMENWLLSIL